MSISYTNTNTALHVDQITFSTKCSVESKALSISVQPKEQALKSVKTKK